MYVSNISKEKYRNSCVFYLLCTDYVSLTCLTITFFSISCDHVTITTQIAQQCLIYKHGKNFFSQIMKIFQEDPLMNNLSHKKHFNQIKDTTEHKE